MILVDFAHLCNRYIFTTISSAKPKKINGKVVTEDISGLFVHGVITNLLYLAKEFSKEYGELVLALEGKSWRKDFYPEYKEHRNKKRNDSEVNWDEMFKIITDLSSSLKNHFGIRTIQTNRAEGDDVIAILVKNSSEKSLIVSSDKDFKQLCLYDHATLFDPIKKEIVTFQSKSEIESELIKHIIKGDESDNIPSVISREKFSPEFIAYLKENEIFTNNPEEFFNLEISKHLVENFNIYETYTSGKNKGKEKETKAIYKKAFLTEKRIKEIEEIIKEKSDDYLLKLFEFNKKLIDFTEIPKDVEKEILEAFKNSEKIEANPMEMMNFCLKYRLVNLVKNLQFFHSNNVKKSELSLNLSEW